MVGGGTFDVDGREREKERERERERERLRWHVTLREKKLLSAKGSCWLSGSVET
jgi:hypothetical protein